MPLLNTADSYGVLTKAFHWIAAALFAFQLASAPLMLTLGEHATAAGLSRDDWYNWHKTIGLVALAVALGRVAARRAGRLPDWAPVLSEFERGLIHRLEKALYVAMFLMPISGAVFVMAGGYGIRFAGIYDLPNPLPRSEALARMAEVLHLCGAVLLVGALAGHLGVVLRHTLLLRDGLIRRMLPRRG